MISKIYLLFFVCVVGISLNAKCQSDNINFTSLSTKDGLSSNAVSTILKDKYGIMWFGTEDGLNRFDGTNFTVYRQRPGDSTSLRANEILALHEDKEGNLWVGTSGGSLSLYNRKKDAFITFPAETGPNSIGNSVIRSICSDYLGNIWIAHFSGISILNRKTNKVTQFKLPINNSISPSSKWGTVVFEDSRRQMWIGTVQGLFRYDVTKQFLERFIHSGEDPLSLMSNNVNDIAEDANGNIWIGTSDGLSKHTPGSKNFINYKNVNADAQGFTSNYISSIGINGDQLWLGTSEGLNIMDIRSGTLAKFSINPRNIHSLTAPAIRCIYIDKQGIYWLGTYSGGINKYDKNLNLFNYVPSSLFVERGLNAFPITSFAEEKSEKIYVGTEGAGLKLFDPNTKLSQGISIKSRRNIPADRLKIQSMIMNRDRLVIGTFSDGLILLNPATRNYQQLLQGSAINDLNSNDIFCVAKDKKGNIWAGTNGDGINVINTQNQVIIRYTPLPKLPNDVKLPINGFIRDIKEDREGNFWIGTHGGGIAIFQPTSGKFTIYNTFNSKLPNDKVYSFCEDSRGNMWIGTKGGGLSLFDKKTRQFTTFSEKEGLHNSTIYKVLEDKKGLIWVSTNKGISNIDVDTKKITNFNYHNGVQNNNFVRGSGLRLSSGELFFGGLEGFNYFDPAFLKKNTTKPSVLITDLRISNQSVAPAAEGPIAQHISVAEEINLDYKQNFALSFVGLNYTSPEQNQYAYKLQGFDKDWNYIGNSTTASYTNLDPGKYTFRVKASNNDGVWNDEGTSIIIYVHPPFWLTVYAYIFYALLLIGVVLFMRHRGIKRLKRKFAVEQEKIRAEQERKVAERTHELDLLKIKFLTNLSHEFRTPISLILGPVDTLLSDDKNLQANSNLNMIKRNARRLLNLVNQLLDFRKMEEQELKLQLTEGELVSFIKDVSDSFKDLSERKKIDFIFTSQIDEFVTLFDHDKIERILFNLLSNAFKFTLERGQISLEIEMEEREHETSKWVLIKISDTGIGIPNYEKEKIFERFFQANTANEILNQGTGIGLSITKEFVQLHGGVIDVASELGKGTAFTIQLPFTLIETSEIKTATLTEITEPLEINIEEESIEEIEATPTTGESELPSILIVEDNEDFRFYLKDNLRLYYKVLEASNGKEGWQHALAQHPQLIVSDISMPYMDGIELCKKIKSDKRTAHIPVILLTALTGEEDQMKGLETGATDYITKPFNFEVLNAKIRNLLALNNTFKNTYTKQIKVITPETVIESGEEKLLQSIMLYLEENLTNPQLSVEELSRHVGMSRSSLYSKLLELTGQTPVEYIRSVKLDKAAVLLKKSDMNVAQIAYSVGFSTPNYFAKSFRAKFNMLPSEYINKMRKQSDKKNTSDEEEESLD